MKKFLIRFAKITGVLVLLLFLSAFIWANWEAPGPGAKAPIVNFLQYDASHVKDSVTIAKIQKTLKKQDGISGSTFNPASKLLVISYYVEYVDKEAIDELIKTKYDVSFKEKVFVQSGPKCPIDVAYITRVKRFLCVRD